MKFSGINLYKLSGIKYSVIYCIAISENDLSNTDFDWALARNKKRALMKIIELKERQDISDNIKLNISYIQLSEFLRELKEKDIPSKIVESINLDIGELNATSISGNELSKLIRQKQTRIIKLVEKELKIVPKNYYRNLWLAIGMSAFGLPLGVAFGLSMGNIGLLAIGLPIGMAIGTAVGSGMDKKAVEEGRQLDIEIKH